MKLDELVTILFKDSYGKTAEIQVTVKELLENTEDTFYELLDDTDKCTSSGCNNESQNFCDCGSSFEDYVICGIELP